MARPAGSPNKDKPFAEALRMELAAAGKNHKKLRSIAAMLITKAEEGELQAIQQIADRLDGKPAQAVTGSDGGPIKQEIAVTWKPLKDDDNG